jgi:hypothetical protein
MRVLSDFTPDLEVSSIDEAFLGRSGLADPHASTSGKGRHSGVRFLQHGPGSRDAHHHLQRMAAGHRTRMRS